MLFRRIRMAAIHHHYRRQTSLRQLRFGFADTFAVVIRTRPSTAQNDMARLIAGCTNDARDAFLVDSEKAVWRPRRLHCIQRDLQTAIRPILEADRHRKPTGHFPMRLRLRRARADRRPRHQVCRVLRDNRIEKFRRRRQPRPRQFQEQLASFFLNHSRCRTSHQDADH